jgi:hypothetical protein
MGKIYILSRDGYRDSTHLRTYARNEQEIIELVTKLEHSYFILDDIELRNIKVDFDSCMVTYEYMDKDIFDEWTEGEYHIFVLDTVENYRDD